MISQKIPLTIYDLKDKIFPSLKVLLLKMMVFLALVSFPFGLAMLDIGVVVIAELENREEFLEEIEEFEKKASGDPDRYKKANSLALAEENKFRAYATKKLAELDAKAVRLCKQFETETGRAFEIDGTSYLEMIKEQNVGRASTPGLSLSKLRSPSKKDEDSKIIRHKKAQS